MLDHLGSVEGSGGGAQQPEPGLALVVASGGGADPLGVERLAGPEPFED